MMAVYKVKIYINELPAGLDNVLMGINCIKYSFKEYYGYVL